MSNATEYDHPQRYTGKDGKDLIDPLGRRNDFQRTSERVSERQHLEVRNKIREQRRHQRFVKSKGISKTSDCI